MIGALSARIDGYWRSPMPAERLAALRVVVGSFAAIYLVARAPHLIGYGSFDPHMFDPVGVVSLLETPLPAWAVWAQVLVTAALAIAFAVGWRFRVTGPLFAALCLWTLTYRHSFGMVFHTDNLMVVQVAILGLAPAADAWSLDARGRALPDPDGRYGWPVRLMCWVVVIAYLLAGVAKLRNGGMDWVSGEVLANHVAIDNARKMVLGSMHSPLAPLVIDQRWLFGVLAILTMAVELGAPLALLGPRIALVWVVGAIGFHLGVLALMVIAFPYPMTGVGLACFVPLERWARSAHRRWQSRRSARAAT